MEANLTTNSNTLLMEQQFQRQYDAGSQQTGLPPPFLPTNMDGTFNQATTARSNVNLMENMRNQYMSKRSVVQQQVSAVDVSKKLLAQYQSKHEEAAGLFKTIEAQLVRLQDAEAVEQSLRTEQQSQDVSGGISVRASQKKADGAMKIHKKDVRNTQERINKEQTDLTVLQTEFDTFKSFIREMGAPVDQWDGVQLSDIGDEDFDLLLDENVSSKPTGPTMIRPLATTVKKSFLEQLNPESSAIPFSSTSDTDVQYSDGMYIPAFESKAHNQRSLNKMMQELEVRLKWPLTIETDRELFALAEFQATLAMTGNSRLEQFSKKVLEVKTIIESNKHYLDRLTIVQLELQLIPKASRQAIAITLQSLGRQPMYRKELSKPGHFETRRSLHMTLPGEVKPDPSANWKNPNKKVSLAVAKTHPKKQVFKNKLNRFKPVKHRPFGKQKVFKRPLKPFRKHNNAAQQQNQQNNRSNNSTCFNCQQKGHIKRNCPNTASERPQAVAPPAPQRST